MGICKCKNRTDLFCFVHKKAVCETCILGDHPTCIVRTYVDWLTDSDYDPPACGICKGELSEDKVVRLTCLDMFHPECLDVHASSLPPHTAKAGYLCPVCSKPIFPPEVDSNPLVKQVTNYLTRASWARNLIAPPPPVEPVVIPMPSAQQDAGVSAPNSTESGVSYKRPMEQPSQDTSFGVASRKSQMREHIIQMHGDEDEEDKYQKRSITQLFVALGLLKPSKSKSNARTRIRLDTRRILVILALVSTLVTVIVLGMSLTSDINTTEEAALDA